MDWAEFVWTCQRHRIQGLVWEALSGLEIDVPEDLVALSAGIAARPEAAPRTRGALARLAPAPERWAS